MDGLYVAFAGIGVFAVIIYLLIIVTERIEKNKAKKTH